MDFKIIKIDLLNKFKSKIKFKPLEITKSTKKIDIPVDNFQFYKSVSSVYSSKIEGEDIDFDNILTNTQQWKTDKFYE